MRAAMSQLRGYLYETAQSSSASQLFVYPQVELQNRFARIKKSEQSGLEMC